MKHVNVGIIGGGRLAQVVATVLGASGAPIRLWARREDARTQLTGALKRVKVVPTVEEACADARVVVLAVPGYAMPEAAALYGPYARGDQVVIHACRGVAEGFVLPHQAIRAETCAKRIVALGGPLYAEKQAADRPMVAVVASRFSDGIDMVRRITQGTPVKLHPVHDVVGVEIAGALSNISALAVGMSDSLELGETARGVLLTRGLSEATRLGVRLGAELATFSGLAGVGDLIPRSVSSTRRHHEIGALIVGGATLMEAQAKVKGSVEGVISAREVAAYADKSGLRLPLVQGIAGILDGKLPARQTIEDLLRMDLELERESVAAAR